MSWEVRNMRKKDWEAVLDIEKQCFKKLNYNKKDLTKVIDDGKVVVVCDIQNLQYQGILGSAIYEVKHNFYELQRIGVNPKYQRCKIGSLLLAVLASRLRLPRQRIIAFVPEENIATQLFLRANNYLATSPIKNELIRMYHRPTGKIREGVCCETLGVGK